MADERHIEKNTSEKLSVKRENWSKEVESPSDTTSHDQKSKFQKFKTADSRHFENSLYRDQQLSNLEKNSVCRCGF